METTAAGSAGSFEGRYYAGKGDADYLQLLDIARRMFAPDPEFQSIPMLYTPAWNGFVEGPTWGAWWIQNSYGPTYCSLPFLQEPLVSFVQNAQDLWFSQMGDGKRAGAKDWVAPDGCLCDAAAPGWIYYKQGDGRLDLHDWGMEFTAAGLVLQSELLLISRDRQAIAHYLPKLERVANFLESRRDPKNNLFLAGAAGNLLAPSYAGWKKPDGTYDRAYLAGLSITTIAGLDRLIELQKLAGRPEQAQIYTDRRALACAGLPGLMTDEGYFIKYLDPDGTRHGVYGAEKHGYFEAICNHDAICFRVADDQQAERIYRKIASIPELRRHGVIITNAPGLDDMYHPAKGLWEWGKWVNGGHWSTCEARMIMGYYRLGKHEDARRSMRHILGFARQYRMDNNLTDFGGAVYQPKEPINTVYDTWGIPAAMVRGLFEYLYRADGLTILPHVPPGITELRQRFPIRFGSKRLTLSTAGAGPVTAVTVNGKPWKAFDARSVFLAYEKTPDEADIAIGLGGSKPPAGSPRERRGAEGAEDAERWGGSASHSAPSASSAPLRSTGEPTGLDELEERGAHMARFRNRLLAEGLGGRYEAAHAGLALAWIAAIRERRRLQAEGKIPLLEQPESRDAAEKLFLDTGNKLCDGLGKAIQALAKSDDPAERRIFRLWRENADLPGWFNIRTMGQSQTFRVRGEVARMTVAGKPESSCGWALDLETPVALPEGARLALTLSGSAGARFFVDLMAAGDKILFQTRWQETPPERKEVSFPLPAGGQLAKVILYTMNTGPEAHNDFARLAIEMPGKEPVVLLPWKGEKR